MASFPSYAQVLTDLTENCTVDGVLDEQLLSACIDELNQTITDYQREGVSFQVAFERALIALNLYED